MGRVIRVDEDVYGVILENAQPLTDTANSVLRRLLEIPDPEVPVPAKKPEVVGHGQRRGNLRVLVERGLLRAGQELVWHRRNLGEVHRATVTDEGFLLLDDGLKYASPAGACMAVSGVVENGWKKWRTQDDVALDDLRQAAQGR